LSNETGCIFKQICDDLQDSAVTNSHHLTGISGEAVAKDINVPLEYVQDQFRRRSSVYQLRPVTEDAIASQQEVGAVFAKAGLIPRPVDVRPLWDARFNPIVQSKT
jgi:ABC-type nitrate/sulfonate/bicarbonate transport system substrate-binding protein